MTDAHFHRRGYETYLSAEGREVRFFGVHPWQVDGTARDGEAVAEVGRMVAADAGAGVGEIGLDRLRTRVVPDAQRAAFAAQREMAAAAGRPVALHGAKCWGEVAKACAPFSGRIPAFLFHGFSRSAGLLPEIFAMNGYVSIGPALLNDHAVNYRELARGIPSDRLLVESDATAENMEDVPRVAEVAAKVAEIRGTGLDELVGVLEANSDRFLGGLKKVNLPLLRSRGQL